MPRVLEDCAYSLRVQVPNDPILTQNLHYNYYYPNPEHLIIGYMDPLGFIPSSAARGLGSWVLDSISVYRDPRTETQNKCVYIHIHIYIYIYRQLGFLGF